MDDKEFQTIILLANHTEIEEAREKQGNIQITDQDPQGWVLLHEILNRPEYAQYRTKTAYRIFDTPLLKKVIEIRCKKNASRPKARPLIYTEKVKGGLKNRKGSAYRLKRNQSAWKALFVAISENPAQLKEYYQTDYYRKRWGYDHPKMIRRFFYALTEPLKFLEQGLFQDFVDRDGEFLAEYQLYPLLRLYVLDEKKFAIYAKHFWKWHEQAFKNSITEFETCAYHLEEEHAFKNKRKIDKRLVKTFTDDFRTQLVISHLRSITDHTDFNNPIWKVNE